MAIVNNLSMEYTSLKAPKFKINLTKEEEGNEERKEETRRIAIIQRDWGWLNATLILS